MLSNSKGLRNQVAVRIHLKVLDHRQDRRIQGIRQRKRLQTCET
jgi:hypothetical protein